MEKIRYQGGRNGLFVTQSVPDMDGLSPYGIVIFPWKDEGPIYVSAAFISNEPCPARSGFAEKGISSRTQYFHFASQPYENGGIEKSAKAAVKLAREELDRGRICSLVALEPLAGDPKHITRRMIEEYVTRLFTDHEDLDIAFKTMNDAALRYAENPSKAHQHLDSMVEILGKNSRLGQFTYVSDEPLMGFVPESHSIH